MQLSRPPVRTFWFPKTRPRLFARLLPIAFVLGAGSACDGCAPPPCVPDECASGACDEQGACVSDDDGGRSDAGVSAACDGGTCDGTPCDDDNTCASDACLANVCVECDQRSDCAGSEACVDGTCVVDDECDAAVRCGGGGTCCPNGAECAGSVCLAPCAAGRCGPDGALCCVEGTTCYGGGCVDVGASCVTRADCNDDEVCEPDLLVCLPEDAVGTCEYIPPPGEFAPFIKCRFDAAALAEFPNRHDVVMAPVVGNLTDDNGDGKTDHFDVPEVVFTTYDLDGDGCCNRAGTIRVVSGGCNPDGSMTTWASISEPATDNSGGLAIGDLDGDGVMEIVAIKLANNQPQGTVAFKRASADGSTWTVMWENDTYPTWNVHTRGGAQPALANLDGVGAPEVIVANVVLNGLTGELLWDGVVTSGGTGGIGNNAFLGPIPVAADLDLDGDVEVIAGNTVYAKDGQAKFTFEFTTQGSPCGGQLLCDGYPAVANLDADPEGEIVLVRQGEVFGIDTDGTEIFRIAIPVDDCVNNESGPPTVADFDGDGRPEIGTAAGDFYVVIDPDCTDPLPDTCDSLGVLWKVPNEDCSSRVTASSVFDFDADGVAEVIYADETSFRIFRGPDGAELFRDDTHGSHTRLEMAVIADVDNDGNAEVVIAENGSNGGTPGVEIWGDALDNWVFTRRIWNQHSYHVTNVSEDGVVSGGNDHNWTNPYLNNFRQNTQGDGVFFAPDLIVTDLGGYCDFSSKMTLSFSVMNQGSRGTGAGIKTAIRQGTDVIGEVTTTKTLLPGQKEAFTVEIQLSEGLFGAVGVSVSADDNGAGVGQQNECIEDNNTTTGIVTCGIIDG